MPTDHEIGEKSKKRVLGRRRSVSKKLQRTSRRIGSSTNGKDLLVVTNHSRKT
jgi:hypothetical protein